MKVISIDYYDRAAENRVADLAVDQKVSEIDYVCCAQ
jgi:hypothetical protein